MKLLTSLVKLGSFIQFLQIDFNLFHDILYIDLIFCDDKNAESVKVITEFLSKIDFKRNPLLLLNNTNSIEIDEQIRNTTKPLMSLSSFNNNSGTAVVEIKKQSTNPDELPQERRFNKLHIGCGNQKLSGFINVDVRPTEAADLVHSCIEFEDFPKEYFDLIYSHAFFEHLNATDELTCLKNLNPLLSNKGKIIFLGIPDFEMIAKSYVEKSIGPENEKFGLMQVYRYTHGAPEQGGEDWWFEQLHKSVFDVDRLLTLLTFAGYNHFVIFRYYFRKESIPLNLGFFASNQIDFTACTSDTIFAEIGKITKDVENKDVEILYIK